MVLGARRPTNKLCMWVLGAAFGLVFGGCSDDITYYAAADATVDSTYTFPDTSVDTVAPSPDSSVDTTAPTPDSGVDAAAPTPDSGVDAAAPSPDTSVDAVAPSPDASVDGPQLTGNEYIGGLIWNKYWEIRATGNGILPTGLAATDVDFIRCKACHGWDALGASGGYVRRTSNATRPAPSVGSDLSAKLATATTADVLNAGGRAFTTLDDTHPDYSLSGGGLSAQQTADVVAFLNSGPKVQDIASLDTAQNPVAYTFTGADTTAGQTLYGTNCATCHGADGQTVGGSILGTYFSSDGKYSEGFHKLIYGDATGAMTRTAQGNLTAEQARDILAYIQANIPGTFPQN